MFQKSVLNSIKQDESLIALRWAEYQKFLTKVDYIKTVKEEKYQDGFLKDIFPTGCAYKSMKSCHPDLISSNHCLVRCVERCRTEGYALLQ